VAIGVMTNDIVRDFEIDVAIDHSESDQVASRRGA
jgi:hypothetical protein